MAERHTPPARPLPRDYRGASRAALPFVDGVRDWQVPPTEDYAGACRVGRDYAAHYLQYLKDNPGYAGLNILGRIAADIDYADASAASGYWVGFFSFLEQLLAGGARQFDVFAYVERVNAHYDQARAEARPRQARRKARQSANFQVL